jgi:hypothetical protein
METETGIMAGCYRNWSTKTSAQKAQAYREELGEDYLEVKAELKHLAFRRRRDLPKAATTREQQMIRELQNVFCKGRYRSWRTSSGL